jgi:hypothetical protein
MIINFKKNFHVELYCGDTAKFVASALEKDCALVVQSGYGTTECIPVCTGSYFFFLETSEHLLFGRIFNTEYKQENKLCWI